VSGDDDCAPGDLQEEHRKPRTIFGVTVKVFAPTGSYDAEKLINVSSNRWAVKTEFGFVFPLKPPGMLELEVGTWFYR
jgi:hypothetical protein